MRLTPTRACLERVAGMFDSQAPDRATQLARQGGAARAAGDRASRQGEVIATAHSAGTRFSLRCTFAK